MSWRTVVVSNSAKLDYQMGFLVVRKETTTKIHLNEISVLSGKLNDVPSGRLFRADLGFLQMCQSL